jgi:hypothetical protein
VADHVIDVRIAVKPDIKVPASSRRRGPKLEAELLTLLLWFALPLAVFVAVCTIVVNVQMAPVLGSPGTAPKLLWHTAVSVPAVLAVVVYVYEFYALRRERPESI